MGIKSMKVFDHITNTTASRMFGHMAGVAKRVFLSNFHESTFKGFHIQTEAMAKKLAEAQQQAPGKTDMFLTLNPIYTLDPGDHAFGEHFLFKNTDMITGNADKAFVQIFDDPFTGTEIFFSRAYRNMNFIFTVNVQQFNKMIDLVEYMNNEFKLDFSHYAAEETIDFQIPKIYIQYLAENTKWDDEGVEKTGYDLTDVDQKAKFETYLQRSSTKYLITSKKDDATGTMGWFVNYRIKPFIRFFSLEYPQEIDRDNHIDGWHDVSISLNMSCYIPSSFVLTVADLPSVLTNPFDPDFTISVGDANVSDFSTLESYKARDIVYNMLVGTTVKYWQVKDDIEPGPWNTTNFYPLSSAVVPPVFTEVADGDEYKMEISIPMKPSKTTVYEDKREVYFQTFISDIGHSDVLEFGYDLPQQARFLLEYLLNNDFDPDDVYSYALFDDNSIEVSKADYSVVWGSTDIVVARGDASEVVSPKVILDINRFNASYHFGIYFDRIIFDKYQTYIDDGTIRGGTDVLSLYYNDYTLNAKSSPELPDNDIMLAADDITVIDPFPQEEIRVYKPHDDYGIALEHTATFVTKFGEGYFKLVDLIDPLASNLTFMVEGTMKAAQK